MTHELPELGYDYNALEPHIDEETMKIHHTKHHQAYIDKLNAALEGKEDLQGKSAEELIKDLNSIPEDIRTAVRNHGGGHANHSFFWKILKADTKPEGEFQEILNTKYNSYDVFKEAFTNAALSVFGSGWAWVVVKDGELEIVTTPNQDSPISQGMIPILALDMWEHNFYLKHNANKSAFIEEFFKVINWIQVNENYNNATGGEDG
jgi:superoxide dismutase, Fe-Mn family